MNGLRHPVRRASARASRVHLALFLLVSISGCAFAAMGRDPSRATVIEIRSRLSSGDGSIRAAIEAANAAERPARIVSRLAPGTVVYVFRELPAVAGHDVTIDAAGLVLRGDDCVRLDGRPGCSGLVVTGEQIVVNDLAVTGFLFDGVSVRRAREVAIRGGRFFANLDDGVGISEAATGVTVESCVIERNGFRTKGKGILVFDSSRAVLRENRIVGNRDGVTVSRRSHAVLDRNEILDSYDKGFGVAGASAELVGTRIIGSGAGSSTRAPAPNADGVRVTIDSTVTIVDSIVSGSGDVAVFAGGRSRVDIMRSSLAGNRGGEVRVADDAVVAIDGREIRAKPRAAAPTSSAAPAGAAPVRRGRTRLNPPHRR
jgi:hypothetical protein